MYVYIDCVIGNDQEMAQSQSEKNPSSIAHSGISSLC